MTIEWAPLEEEHCRLGWKIIGWKIAYYMPERVHPSRRADYDIDDGAYDEAEQRYLTLCRQLGIDNTVVHKRYPGFEDVDYSNAMQEVDLDRPSVQLVMSTMSRPKLRKQKCK